MKVVVPHRGILLLTINLFLLMPIMAVSEPAASTEKPAYQFQLLDCQTKLGEWKDWAAKNVPKHEELMKEYEKVKARNEELERNQDKFWLLIAAVCAFGLGAGVYCLRLLIRLIRQIRPLSQARKQLFTLLGAVLWVTLAVLLDSDRIANHPINALAAALFWSLPALLLAGILFWWFGRTGAQQA